MVNVSSVPYVPLCPPAYDVLFYPWGINILGGTPSGFSDFMYEDNTDWLLHTDNRQYTTGGGRWMSPDPAGLAAVDVTNPQSLNMYTYALNNPTTFTDPSGLFLYNYPALPILSIYGGDMEVAGSDWGNFPTVLPIGGGGGRRHPTTWSQLQPLVHQNNASLQCDELIDCIIFNESHLGNTLDAGFSADAVSSTLARGLMQVEHVSVQDVLTNGLTYPVANATVQQVWGQMFDPAQNIQIGSAELRLKLIRDKGNLRQAITDYGPTSGSPNYAKDIVNCVQKLQSGDAAGAFAAATAHN